MASDLNSARRTKYSFYLLIYVIVVLAVVGAANYLADRYNKSVDVTTSKKFTLSEQTEKVVGGLKTDLNIYYFDNQGKFERARDLFDRYKNLSSKLNIVYVDPDKKPDLAQVEGVRQLGDIIVDNGKKRETAKSLTEEELTGAIVRVNKGGSKTVCFVEGSGEHALADTQREGYSTVKEALEKNNYKTQAISLLEKPEIPKDCTIVIVGGPKRDYLEPAIGAVKTFLAVGGKVILEFDPVLTLREQKLGDTPGLVKLASEWGVTANPDVVLDLGAASQMFGQLSPVATKYESHPIVRVMGGNATVFTLSRSLDVKAPAEKLFSTGASSFSIKNPKLPIKEADLDKADKGPFVLGAAGTVGAGATQGRWVVVGSSNWIANSILAAPLANRDLVLNMMNWLSADEDLISIRPKEPEDRRLTITSSGISMLFFTSVIFLPLIVILAGVSTWWKRR